MEGTAKCRNRQCLSMGGHGKRIEARVLTIRQLAFFVSSSSLGTPKQPNLDELIKQQEQDINIVGTYRILCAYDIWYSMGI